MAYEKMPCLYDTEHDLMDRLGNTLCRYDGKVYRVVVVSAKKLELWHPVSTKCMLVIKPTDPLFDISSPEIGYFNTGKNPDPRSNWPEVVYMFRQPYRRFRQGLNADSTLMYRLGSKVSTSSSYYWESQGLIDSIEGVFPPFDEAVSSLRLGKFSSAAISRDIAFEIDKEGLIHVFCKQEKIGWIYPGDSTVSFKESQFSWVYQKMADKNHLPVRRKESRYVSSF